MVQWFCPPVLLILYAPPTIRGWGANAFKEILLMGKKDTVTKEFMRRPDVFADAFNLALFEGSPVIQP